MKNKKAFTLVELLAVIVILVIVLLISVPTLINNISNKKNEGLNKIYDLIEMAARNYAIDYNIDITENTKIKLEDLCKTDYIECPIINSVTNEELNGCINISDDGEFEYGSC